jgi:hypothetical protein
LASWLDEYIQQKLYEAIRKTLPPLYGMPLNRAIAASGGVFRAGINK